MARVAAAEDDPASAILLEEILGLWGHEAVIAPDGEALLAVVESGAFEIVLLDLQMPVLDGWGTLERLRRLPLARHLPVVAVSAFAREADRDRALAFGFDAFVAKPIHFEALRLQIEELLARASSSRA